MRSIKYTIAVVATLAASTSFAGQFGTIDIAWNQQSARFGNGGGFDFDYSNLDFDGVAETQGWVLSPSIKNGQLYTFCLELAQTITSASRTYMIDPLTSAQVPPTSGTISANSAAALNLMAVNFFESAKDGSLAGILNVATGKGYSAATAAAAFQLAVWELALDRSVGGDSDISLSTTAWNPVVGANANGHLGNTAIKAGADWLLSKVDGLNGDDVSDVAGKMTVALTHNNHQEQLIVVSVPEASSLLAFASVAGAIGLVMYRRRK
ncbi:hypothetical protein [Aeoliella sp.]|uniref:hypothetical protein n=1 Tax=Aeoliella sp. TaxID=2795800 RepID=UPI003CCC22A1